jgi:hypothetical protein
LIIFILSYLFVLPTSFLRIRKTQNPTSLQVWLANVLYFCYFCKPTFSGDTREWDALYDGFMCHRGDLYSDMVCVVTLNSYVYATRQGRDTWHSHMSLVSDIMDIMLVA